MKLLFAIKSLNVAGGGAERVLVDVANGLSARGHEVTVMTFDSPGEPFYRLGPGIKRIELEVGPPGKPTPRAALVAALPRMRKAAILMRPDLVVAFMHSFYVPLGVALLGSGIRVVASEHIGVDHYKARPLQRLMVSATNPLFCARTVPSAAIRDENPARNRKDVSVLPNPIDLADFNHQAANSPAASTVILTVGRFMEQKNHTELLRAFHQVAPDFPGWRLRLVGDGDLRPDIEREIALLGLGDLVELAGSVRDMAAEYGKSAIVAIPSIYESFGLVAAEALASGRPVVGFAECPGTNDLILDGINGLHASRSVDAVASFAGALRSLMADPSLRSRLGAAGPGSVLRFGMAGVLDQWEAFLERARAA